MTDACRPVKCAVGGGWPWQEGVGMAGGKDETVRSAGDGEAEACGTAEGEGLPNVRRAVWRGIESGL